LKRPCPLLLAKRATRGFVYREPYGVALIIGPFTGPLLLLDPPGIGRARGREHLSSDMSEALPATTDVLLDLVPKYFDPTAVTVVAWGKEQNTELLKLSFDFIFFTGSTMSARSSHARRRRPSRPSFSNWVA